MAEPTHHKDLLNPEYSHEEYNSGSPRSRDIKTIKGRLESQHEFNSSMREDEPGVHYPVG